MRLLTPLCPHRTSCQPAFLIDFFNSFTGGFYNALEGWLSVLSDSLTSSVNLASNGLSGPIPQEVYDVTQEAHGLDTLTLSDNYFLCARSRCGQGCLEHASATPDDVEAMRLRAARTQRGVGLSVMACGNLLRVRHRCSL